MFVLALSACLPISPTPAPVTASTPSPTAPPTADTGFPPMTWGATCAGSASTSTLPTSVDPPDSGHWDYYGLPGRGRLQVLDGPALLGGARVLRHDVGLGLGIECELSSEPTVGAPGDVDLDGLADFGVVCRDAHDTFLQVVSGASIVAGAPVALACVRGVYRWTPVGDLDRDHSPELAFSGNLMGDGPHWVVRPSSTLPGDTIQGDSAWALDGADEANQEHLPLGIGDVDGDGIGDLAVFAGGGIFQDASSIGPIVLIASGAAVAATPLGDVFGMATQGLARIEGTWGLGDFASTDPAGDLDGDGLQELALSMMPWSARWVPHGKLPAEVHILFADDLATADLDSAPLIRGTHSNRRGSASAVALGDRDGDGLDELAVRLNVDSSSEDEQSEIAVIPGAVLALVGPGSVVDAAPYALASTDPKPYHLVACDLDGDGLKEVLTDGDLWAGTNLAPGAAPIPNAAYLQNAVCAGDLDGLPGEELVEVDSESYLYY